ELARGRARQAADGARPPARRHPASRTWLIGDGAPSPAPELPVVLKPRFGSWGRDVARCETADSLACTLAHFGHRPWFAECGVLAQELVPPLGWGLRLVVAGGELVGCARGVATRHMAAAAARSQPRATRLRRRRRRLPRACDRSPRSRATSTPTARS